MKSRTLKIVLSIFTLTLAAFAFANGNTTQPGFTMATGSPLQCVFPYDLAPKETLTLQCAVDTRLSGLTVEVQSGNGKVKTQLVTRITYPGQGSNPQPVHLARVFVKANDWVTNEVVISFR